MSDVNNAGSGLLPETLIQFGRSRIDRRRWIWTARHVRDIVLTLDGVVVFVAALLAKGLYFDVLGLSSDLASDYPAVSLLTALVCYSTLKSIRPQNDGVPTLSPGGVVKGLVLGFGVVVLVGFGLKLGGTYSRGWMGVWFVLAIMLVLAKDVVVRRWASYMASLGHMRRTIAIYGATTSGVMLKSDLLSRATGNQRIEIYDDTPQAGIHGAVAVRGDLATLIEDGFNNAFERIIFCLPPERIHEIPALVERVGFLPVDVQFCPEQPALAGLRPRVVCNSDRYFVTLLDTPFPAWGGAAKRAMDLIIGAIALAFAAPFMLLIAAAIKLDSPGTVFFRQRRNGYNHEVIQVIKFRTMTTADDGDVVKQATRNDARVTRVGRFLRKTSLDELPQLFNVLSGEMSLVGPRPHAVAHNKYYSEHLRRYPLRHKVKPGITGWAQIKGLRGESETVEVMAARATADIYYIENWSLWLDIRILVLTPFVVPFQKSAF